VLESKLQVAAPKHAVARQTYDYTAIEVGFGSKGQRLQQSPVACVLRTRLLW